MQLKMIEDLCECCDYSNRSKEPQTAETCFHFIAHESEKDRCELMTGDDASA